MVTLQNLIEFDNTVLDGLEVPEGLDVNALKSVVKMRLGLCYPTYDEPDVFKSMLTTWSFAHQWNMQHLIKANSVDYAPLENYDRSEDFTDRNTGGATTNDTNTNTANRTDTNTNTADRTFKTDSETTGSGTSETENTTTNTNTVSAYNASTFQNDNKSDGTGTSETSTSSSGEIDETKKETGTYTDRRNITGTITDARVITVQNNGNVNHAGRAHGNIGVTTTQQMFESEINLMRGYNIYYEICNWIERDLFIQVY